MARAVRCEGCGALVEDLPGRAHDYIGASQGCWKLYGEVLAKQHGEFGYPQLVNRLTVDTYAVQHPGKRERRSIQSVNIHLISLHLVLVDGWDGARATRKMSEILVREPKFSWLEPPIPNGNTTVAQILEAADFVEHERNVKIWAEDVWQCWYSRHKEAIKGIVASYC